MCDLKDLKLGGYRQVGRERNDARRSEVRKCGAMRGYQRPILLLEARARECIGVASRKTKRKRERAVYEAHGMKMPQSLLYDPKPL